MCTRACVRVYKNVMLICVSNCCKYAMYLVSDCDNNNSVDDYGFDLCSPFEPALLLLLSINSCQVIPMPAMFI